MTIDDVRVLALSLPRSYEALVRELVVDAWRMVVPKRVATEHLGAHWARIAE